MLMLLMAVLGLVQLVRGFLSFYRGEGPDIFIMGVVCLVVTEVVRRQNYAAPEEDKEVVPNRPHPLERPQLARPSVPSLPSDK